MNWRGMYTKELLVYIKKSLNEGVSREKLTRLLVGKGWSEADIQRAFYQLESQVTAPSVAPAPPSAGAGNLVGVGELLTESFSILKQRFVPILGVLLLPQLVYIGFGFVYSLIVGVSTALFSSFTSLNFGAIGLGVVLPFVLLIMIAFFVQIWGTAAIIELVSNHRTQISIIDCYKRVLPKLWPLLVTQVIMGIIVGGSAIFFIIPAYILTVYFFAAYYMVIDGKATGITAVLRSKKLVEGYWWAVLGRFAALILLIFGLMIGYSIITYPIQALFDESAIISLLLNLVMGVIAIPLIAFPLIYARLVYEGLVRIKGDFDYTPTGQTKALYIGIGVFGILAYIALFAFITTKLADVFRMDEMFPSGYEYELDSQPWADFDSDLYSVQIDLELYKFTYEIYPATLDALAVEYETNYDPRYLYEASADQLSYRLCIAGEDDQETCVTNESIF